MARTKQLTILATFLLATGLSAATPTVAHAQTAEEHSFKLTGPPWLGVRMTDDASSGVRIAGVAHGSPAQKAGLRAGDVVTHIGGERARSAEHLSILIRGRRAGDVLPLAVERSETRVLVKVKLEEMPSRTEVVAGHLVGRNAPDFRARLIAPDGGETRLDAFRGKPIVLEFWATWCGPCREMSANLKKLKSNYGDRLHVLALSAEKEKVVRDFIRRKGAPYVVGRDLERSAHDNYFVVSFPTVVLIDADGRVAAVGLGNGDFPRFEKQVASLLESSDPSQSEPSK